MDVDDSSKMMIDKEGLVDTDDRTKINTNEYYEDVND